MKNSMSRVYGPVPSWRLGRSLGIDPLLPPKTCTFDCIYCQLGKTVNKISKPEDLKTRVEVSGVIKDLEKALQSLALESVDYVTFSGSGEPTLNLMLGKMIDLIRDLVGEKPIAVLTNASLVNYEKVRENLAKADLVVAKLDAPTQNLFEVINRPAERLALSSIIEGLKALRHEIHGRLALQIMFLKSTKGGKFNTQQTAIEDLVQLANAICPDEVQINTPTRPPSENYVLPLQPHEIDRISEEFKTELKGVEVLSRSTPAPFQEIKKKAELLSKEILELLKRRPCRLPDLVNALGSTEKNVKSCLNDLLASDKIASTSFRGQIYYRTATNTV